MRVSDWKGKTDVAEVSSSNEVKTVLFAAKWCGYCARFLEIARDFQTSNDIELVLVDTDDPDESLWDIYNL